jgi:DNA repair protein RadC
MARNKKGSIDHLKGGWAVAELTISYKPTSFHLPQLTATEEAYKLIRSVWDRERISLQEQFMAFFLNRNNRLIGYKLISTGTMKSCVVDIKLLVGMALVSQSEQVIIAHNHPSGNLNKSTQDEAITKKIKEALALIDVKLIDHFIVTDNGYLSFAEEGLFL